MDYTTYKTRVANELNRSDLTTQIADWINEARKQIADGSLPVKDLGWHRFSWLFQNTSQELTSGTNLYDWPDGCIDEISLFYPTKDKPLHKVMDPAQMDALYYDGNSSTGTGEPTDYCLWGTQYQVYPTPDGTYTIYLRYYGLPDDLSDSTDEETIDTKHPELVISAATLLGAIYLHDADLVALYSDLTRVRYQNAVTLDKKRKGANRTSRVKTYHDYNTAQWRAMRGC